MLNFKKEFDELDKLKFTDTNAAKERIQQLLTYPWSELQRLKLKVLLAYCNWANNQIHEAKEQYLDVLNEAERLNSLEEKADALSGLGTIDNEEGNYEQAYQKFLKRFKSINY